MKTIKTIIFSSSIILFIFAFSFPGTNAQNNKKSNMARAIEVFEVAERSVPCERAIQVNCLLVKRRGDREFKTFSDEIENFAFIPGYKYVLRVEVEKMGIVPKDTSGYKYYLKEVVSRFRVENQDPAAGLFGHPWNLIRIKGKSVKYEQVNGDRPFIKFNKDKGSAGGFLGCNVFGADFRVDGNAISISNLISTKMACPDLAAVEIPFSINLMEADEFKVGADRLYLYKNGGVILEFEPGAGK